MHLFSSYAFPQVTISAANIYYTTLLTDKAVPFILCDISRK